MGMKTIVFFIAAFLSISSLAGMEEVRDLFSKSSVDENATKKLIELTKNASLKTNPILYAYHAGATMSMANHVYWPGSKLSYFNEGKEKLEKAVNFAYKNVEIRFIRYAIQFGAPAMLGYSQNLSEDKAYILKHINETDWSGAYKKEVRDYLN